MRAARFRYWAVPLLLGLTATLVLVGDRGRLIEGLPLP
jgi:hypothetical protein